MTVRYLHSVDRPYSIGAIEIYGDADAGWYEWQITNRYGVLMADSGYHGPHGTRYDSLAVALRDAINVDLEGLYEPEWLQDWRQEVTEEEAMEELPGEEQEAMEALLEKEKQEGSP